MKKKLGLVKHGLGAAILVVASVHCGSETTGGTADGDASAGDAQQATDAGPLLDGAGDEATADANGSDGADRTPPTVVLAASPTTVTVAGDIAFNVAANDSSGIAKVVLYVDAVPFATLAAAPYAATRAVSSADNGTHTFFAEATDNAGNVGKSAPVTVKIDIAGPPPAIPSFVAAGAPTVVSASATLSLPTPAGTQANDLLLAIVDAEESAGPRTLPTPTGWTLVAGLPIHNVAADHTPFVIPATENQGMWIFYRIALASEPAATAFVFPTAATARGAVVSYRGVDTAAPIHDKTAQGFYGTGGTNGLGMGTTTLQNARQVNLIATAVTAHPTYTNVLKSASISERVNSGEQPNGLNVIVHDAPVTFGFYSGPSIANKQSPSGSADGFLFSATTLVLKPQ